jgi:lambda family phage tail tape measure protein
VSDFDFQIKADPADANKAIAGVETGLDRLKDKGSNIFTDAQGRQKDATGRFLATGKAAGEAGNAMERAAEQATGLFEVLEAYAGLHAVEAILDGYTEVGNKIRSVTETQENFNGVMNATYEIAQSTRQSWNETASSFQRLSNATRGLGLSQRDALDLQKELAQATALSGATAQEAAMTQRELMHAFETGNLTMREWKVIQRDAPALVNELKIASGKTGAEMAAMAHSGQLSAQTLIDWFGKAKDAIEEKFGRLIPTISEDLLMLKNAAEKFFGEAGDGAGIMQGLATATRFLIDNFATISKVILGVGEALLSLYVIEKITTMMKALLTTSITLSTVLTVIVVGVSLLRQFGDAIETNNTVMTQWGSVTVTVGDYMRSLWTMLKEVGRAVVELGQEVVGFIEDGWKKLTSAFSEGLNGQGIEFSLRNVLLFMGSFADAAIGIFRVIGDTLIAVFNDATTAIGLAFQNMLNGVIHAANSLRNGLLNVLSTFDKRKAETAAETDAAQDYNRAFQAALSKGSSIPDAGAAGLKAQNATPMSDRIQQQYAIYNFDKNGRRQAGGIDDVEIVDPNAAAKFKDQLGKKIDEDLKTSVVKDLIDQFMDKWDSAAAEEAKKRAAADHGKKADTILTNKGPKDAELPSEKYEKLITKLDNELRSLLESTNPQIKATEELAHGQDILNAALATGDKRLLDHINKYGGATAIMERYREKLADQIDPLTAEIRKIEEHSQALTDDADVTARNLDVQKAFDAYRKATGNSGNMFTDALAMGRIREAVESSAEREKLLKQEQTDIQALLGPMRTWIVQQDALNDLLAKGKITQDQYNRTLDQQRQAYLEASGEARTFAGGMESAWLQIKSDVTDVGGTIKKVLTDAFQSVNDAIVSLVMTGTNDWHKMVDSMLEDLTRLILKQLEAKAIMSLLGGVSDNPVDNVAGMQSALGGLGFAQYGGSGVVPATGGAFTVGGAGSTDSKLVAFRATPGEKVTIETADQQRAQTRAPGGGEFHAHMIVVNNQEEATIAAMGSRRGSNVQIMNLQQNRRAVSHVTKR